MNQIPSALAVDAALRAGSRDRADPREPRAILDRWRALRREYDAAARAAATDLEREVVQGRRLEALEACMSGLAADMAAAPVSGDADLVAKLELWRMLVEYDSDEALHGPEIALVLSVGAELSRRSRG